MRLVAALAAALSLAVTLAATPAVAQAPPAATTIRALLGFPAFFHQKEVVVRGEITSRGGVFVLTSPDVARPMFVVVRAGRPGDGPAEVRGQAIDAGRLTADDPRFRGFDITALLDAETGGRWPGQGEMLIVLATDVTLPSRGIGTTIRSIALEPERYEGQRVTVVGQFGGRNLYGDLPQAPRAGKWDFVLRSAGAAVWVTGIRPRGDGFDLDPGAKVDTGRWLRVSGLVRRSEALVLVEATSVAATKAEEDARASERPAPPPGPPPEVRFSVPAEGETDVPASTSIRVQFSRDLDQTTLAERVRVSYADAPAGAAPAPVAFTMSWDAGNRVLTIRFPAPLERFRTVRIEIAEGVTGTDGQALKPWALSFTTGLP